MYVTNPEKKRYRLIAHNGCKYDFVYFIPYLDQEHTTYYGEPDNFKGLIWNDKLYFVDFFRIFPGKLENLAKSWLGGTETKLNHTDFSKITHETWKNYIEEMSPYVKQDVRLLSRLWTKFEEFVDSFEIKDASCGRMYKINIKNTNIITASGLSHLMFKKCFLQKTVHPCPREFYDVIEASYFGGVVQNMMIDPPP